MVEMYIKAVDAVGACCHSAVLGAQLIKVCYYSITHSLAPPHGSHVPPALEWLPALFQQGWLRGLEKDGTPTPAVA